MAAPVHNPEVIRDFGMTGHSGRDYRTEPGTPVRPQFDLHTNARMRVVAPDGSAEEGAA